MPTAVLGDREIRYEPKLFNLAVDRDATVFGDVETVLDSESGEELILVSSQTWAFLFEFGLTGAAFDFVEATGPGTWHLPMFQLGMEWMDGRIKSLAAALLPPPPADVAADDIMQHVEISDPESPMCVAAPSCLQDVDDAATEQRGFTICAYHDNQLGGIDSLLDGR